MLSSVFKLFDFDLEVKPMLQVLVGKTIEQALLEVMEEEELANLRANQYAYEEIRNVELAEVQRLEEQERRHREEKVELSVCLSCSFISLISLGMNPGLPSSMYNIWSCSLVFWLPNILHSSLH